MNIGIYSPYLNTMTGGEKYMLTAASYLSKYNKVSIFWDDSSILDKAESKFGLDLSKVQTTNNIFKSQYNTISRFLASRNYDLIIFLSDGSIPLLGSKKLYIHFQFPVEWVKVTSLTKLKISRVSKVFCNSHFTKKFIDKKFEINSHVLYPPCEVSDEQKGMKENIILSVGRYVKFKNGTDFKKLSVLIKAFKEFQKKRLKNWKFVIVTSVIDEEQKNFQEFKKLAKSKHIEIVESASHDEIKNLNRKAKIYWHATGFGENLDKHPERAEHFGMSTVEAMSYYVAPVVINEGGQKEIISNGENGFLWNSIEELVAKTHELAINNDLYERISRNAKKSSSLYSSDRFKSDLDKLISG